MTCSGGAAVLFAKERSRREIINDLDENLINFWRVVRNRHDELINSFRYTLASRKVFDEYKAIYRNGTYTDDIQRAHIFYYLNSLAFSGDMLHPSFGVRRRADPNLFYPKRIKESIENAYERIQHAIIECADFATIFKSYDNDDALFYIDPPYHNAKQYAVGAFREERYQELADLCRNLKGKFLMTINDDDFVRELFQGFHIMTHDVAYSVCRFELGVRRFSELLVANYDIEKEVSAWQGHEIH